MIPINPHMNGSWSPRNKAPGANMDERSSGRQSDKKGRRKKYGKKSSKVPRVLSSPHSIPCPHPQTTSVTCTTPSGEKGQIGDYAGRNEGVGGAGDQGAFAGKKRRRENDKDVVRNEQPTWPFATEYGDHFETPIEAYRDVEMVLILLAKQLGKKKRHLRIWDPYVSSRKEVDYCAGRTSRLLAQLGFSKVEHRNQDFYAVISNKNEPVHDVLVTNPPYSGDHKQRCLEYCRASGKPWLLLVPNYVATKDYYRLAVLGPAAAEGGEPFYVVPAAKYDFDHPEGTGHDDSPFFALWYVHCGRHTETVFQAAKANRRNSVFVVPSVEDLGRVGAVRTERRLNPRQRKALKKKRNAAATGL